MANGSLLASILTGSLKGFTQAKLGLRERLVKEEDRKRKIKQEDLDRQKAEREARLKMLQSLNEDVRRGIETGEPPVSIIRRIRATYPAEIVAEIFPETQRTLPPSPNEVRGETPTPVRTATGGVPGSLLAWSQAANAPKPTTPPTTYELARLGAGALPYGADVANRVYSLGGGTGSFLPPGTKTVSENREERLAEAKRADIAMAEQKLGRQLRKDEYDILFRAWDLGLDIEKLVQSWSAIYAGTGEAPPPRTVGPVMLNPPAPTAAPSIAPAPTAAPSIAPGPTAAPSIAPGPNLTGVGNIAAGGRRLPGFGDLSPAAREGIPEATGVPTTGPITFRAPSVPKKQPTAAGGAGTPAPQYKLTDLDRVQRRMSTISKEMQGMLVRKLKGSSVALPASYSQLAPDQRVRYDDLKAELAGLKEIEKVVKKALGIPTPSTPSGPKGKTSLSSKDEREIGSQLMQYGLLKKSGKKVGPWVRQQLRNNGFTDENVINDITKNLMNKYFGPSKGWNKK